MATPRKVTPNGPSERPGPSLGAGAWLAWARGNPALAVAVLAFCVGAVAVLALSVPLGMLRSTQPGQLRATASRTSDPGRPTATPSGSAGSSGSWNPPPPPEGEPAKTVPAAGPWVEQPPAPPSPRGLALAYRYRRLPPGGDSNYQWIVQIRGAPALFDEVELVTWHMDPPPKNEGELISRDRARDGFPLFGDGPGGWFGVSAVVTFKDGDAETLARKIELPDPS